MLDVDSGIQVLDPREYYSVESASQGCNQSVRPGDTNCAIKILRWNQDEITSKSSPLAALAIN
jgi:hypothetical protein